MNNIFTTDHITMLVACFLLSYIISNILIRRVIELVTRFNLMDKPNHRKTHVVPTPSMGGIAIVLTIFAFYTFIAIIIDNTDAFIIMVSLISFSALGFIDDWKNLNAKLKLAIQMGLSTMAYLLGFKLDNAFGLFGIYELEPMISFIITIGFYILLINAYNLIDGIDELAGGIIAINFGVFTILFVVLGAYGYVLFSVVAFGAVKGFLKFNAHPAKIFMGDSGSLPLGMIMALFSFKVIQLIQTPEVSIYTSHSILPTIVALNFIPFFDTLRVFTLRISKGFSPFQGDRNHLHHLLLKNNLGHKKSAFFIQASHAVIILSIFLIAPYLSLWTNLLLVVILTSLTFEWNTFFRIRIKSKLRTNLNKKENDALKTNKLLKTLND